MLIGLFWWRGNQARVEATDGAKKQCHRHGFQFLDGTVSMHRLGMQRVNGRLSFYRVFRFEYADQQMQRWAGYVMIRAPGVAMFHMDPESLGEHTDNHEET